MKKIILSFLILFVSITTLVINLSYDTIYAFDLPYFGEFTTDNGKPGQSYTAQIRCKTTNTNTDITYYPWTGGAPVEDVQINTNTEIEYVTATLCNYFPALTLCTEHIPC